MKTIVLALLLMQATLPLPRQTSSSGNHGSSHVKGQAANQQQQPAPLHVSPSLGSAGGQQGAGAKHTDPEDSVRVVARPKKDWTDWVLWGASVLLAIVGSLGVSFAFGTLKAIRKQSGIMQDSSENQLRAYVLEEGALIVDGTMLNPPQFQRANVPGVVLRVRNYGQTPAYSVVSWAGIAIISPDEEDTLPPPPEIPDRFSATVGPGAFFTKSFWFDRALTPLEVTDIGNGARAIYLYGRIEYRDAFRKPRFSDFRLHYQGQFPPNPDVTFNYSERGNHAN